MGLIDWIFTGNKKSSYDKAIDVASTLAALAEKSIDTYNNSKQDISPAEEPTSGNAISYYIAIPDDISYFKPEEFYNKSDKDLVDTSMDPELVHMLNVARYIDGSPWKVNSGKRSKEWNAKVGGKANSAHLRGKAVDISATTGERKLAIVTAAIKAGFTRIGINKSFIHLDNDSSLPNPTLFLY